MKKKTEEVSVSNKLKVYQSNALTEGRYDYSLIEKRIMYGIIVKCREKYIIDVASGEFSGQEQEMQVSGQKDLFNDLVVFLKMDDLKKADANTSRVYDAAKRMRAKTIEINNEDEWICTGFINYAKHKKNSGLLEIGVSKEILPQLVELTRCFTSFELTVAITLKSTYTQRLYELCSQWKKTGYAIYPVAKLRTMLHCEDKFKTFGEFRRGVLDLAQKELKASYDDGICDLYFTWDVAEKTVKRVDVIKIIIHDRNSKPAPAYTPEDLHYFIKTQLAQYFPKNKDFVKRVLGKCQEDFTLAELMQQKITKICLKYTVQERPAVLKHVIDMDFDIV